MIDTNLLSFPEEKVQKLMAHYKEILALLGEDPEREGLLKTPERVAKAMLTLTRGYEVDPKAVLSAAKFKEEYRQMVIVKDIDFFSMCEHHMLHFYGKAHVAYIPNGYILMYPNYHYHLNHHKQRYRFQKVQIRYWYEHNHRCAILPTHQLPSFQKSL